MVVRRNKHTLYIIFASKQENFIFYWASIGVDKNDRPQCLDLTAISCAFVQSRCSNQIRTS